MGNVPLVGRGDTPLSLGSSDAILYNLNNSQFGQFALQDAVGLNRGHSKAQSHFVVAHKEQSNKRIIGHPHRQVLENPVSDLLSLS
jgi:hypothetical protein